MQGRPSPRETANKIWHERFSDALALFCAGSVIRGDGTAHSDLDIVVLFEHVPHAHRESLIVDGWPVELFVHDYQTLAYRLLPIRSTQRLMRCLNTPMQSRL